MEVIKYTVLEVKHKVWARPEYVGNLSTLISEVRGIDELAEQKDTASWKKRKGPKIHFYRSLISNKSQERRKYLQK